MNDENKELAQTLKKDSDLQRRPAATKSVSSKKKAGGSDRSSNRGSEERQPSLPAGGRGQKRGRDYEIEKVGDDSIIRPSSPLSDVDGTFSGLLSPEPVKELSTMEMQSEVDLTLDRGRTPVPVPAIGENRKSSMFWDRRASQIIFPEALSSTRTSRSTKPKPTHWLKQGNREISSRPVARPRTRKTSAETTEDILEGTQKESRLLRESGWLTEYPDYPALLTAHAQDNIHPQLKKLNVHDPGNISKRIFFHGQDPKAKLIIAGVPRDGGLHPTRSTTPTKSDKMPGVPKARNEGDWRGYPSVEAATDALQELVFSAVDNNNQEEAFLSRPQISIPCPDHLKSILVDDWENVTKNLHLVPLPSKTPVNMILDTYYEEEKAKRRPGSAEADILEEVVAGIKEYFQHSLGRILLYRFEREQYHEIRQLWEGAVSGKWEGKGPGDVYGAEHLARLFGKSNRIVGYPIYALTTVAIHAYRRIREGQLLCGSLELIMISLQTLVSLPGLVAQTNMDQQSVNRMREELTKLTQWLARHSDKYFTAEYEAASQDYIEKARGV